MKNIKTQVSGSFINKTELKQNQNATPDHIIAKLEKNTNKEKKIIKQLWGKKQNTFKEIANKNYT